jgi:hypothetical protein
MAEEGTTLETGTASEGQVAEGSGDAQATPGAPGAGDGESSEGAAGITTQGTQASAEETFFDPASVPEDLKPAYKNMQRAFGRKMESIKAGREKIEAFDAFNSDPIGSLQKLATQYGFNLTRGEAQQIANQQAGNTNWEPQSWDEVLTKAEERAYARLQREQQPIQGELQRLRKSNLETYLDSNAPDWREYEDSMMDNLREHPTLVNNPMKLYRLSVPPETIEGRAMQKALKKLEDKAQSVKTGGSSTTTRQASEGLPDKELTFDEAVQAAKKKLAADGMKPPG